MISSKPGYVRSPLLDASADSTDLEELARQIESEIKSIASNSYEPEVTNPNLPKYDFDQSINEEKPDYWRPVVANATTMEDETVEEWYEEAVQQLKGHEDFRVVKGGKEIDSLTGETPPVEIYVEDREQLTGTISLKGEVERDCIPVEKAIEILSDQAPNHQYNHEEVPDYSTQRNDLDIDVEADLSTGFFQAEVDLGPYKDTSQVWMPYANREEALLVSMPSDLNNQLQTDIVPVAEDSFTGNEVTDAVAESLSYFLPFEEVIQTETSPEAISYRNENPLGKEPYRKRIEGNAWNKIKQMSPELQRKFMQKTDELTIRPDKSPLEKRGEKNIDQIMGEDHYVTWQADQNTETLNIKNVLGRHEAFPKGSNKKRK